MAGGEERPFQRAGKDARPRRLLQRAQGRSAAHEGARGRRASFGTDVAEGAAGDEWLEAEALNGRRR